MKSVGDLIRAVQRNPGSATEELRRFVAENTFPIIDGESATFFFWDGHPTEAVHLMHWVFGLESRQAFRRIPGTEAFFLTLELPHGARVEYKLELQRGGHSQWVRDPLNPLRAFDPFGSNSVAPMTGYEEPAWVKPEDGVRGGRIESFSFDSHAWGSRREIKVYLPNEYKAHKRYPLLICHDGDDYMRFAAIKTVLDNLIHRHEVMPLIVAFTSGSEYRNAEYGANPNQVAFIVDEVLLEVAKRHKISQEPEDLGLMGASFGAVSTLFTAWSRPGIFGRLLLQSGSFVFTDIGRHDRGPLWDPVVGFVNQLRQDPARLKSRIYMSCGAFEGLIYYNRSLAPLLRKEGLEVRFVESRDGHNWINWRDRLREGLTFLFPGHLWMYYD